MEISSTILATATFLFLLLPGFVYLRAFWGSNKGAISPDNFYSYLIFGLLASSVLYPISYFVYSSFCYIVDFMFDLGNYSISIEKICTLAVGYPKNLSALLFELSRLFLLSVLADFIALFGAVIIRQKIINERWDLKYSFLKFKNTWFYTLTGRSNKIPENIQVYFHLMYEAGGQVILYKGLLENYGIKNDALEYIHLSSVYRTKLFSFEELQDTIEILTGQANTPASEKLPTYYTMGTSNVMIFKMNEVKNFHISYNPLTSE